MQRVRSLAQEDSAGEGQRANVASRTICPLSTRWLGGETDCSCGRPASDPTAHSQGPTSSQQSIFSSPARRLPSHPREHRETRAESHSPPEEGSVPQAASRPDVQQPGASVRNPSAGCLAFLCHLLQPEGENSQRGRMAGDGLWVRREVGAEHRALETMRPIRLTVHQLWGKLSLHLPRCGGIYCNQNSGDPAPEPEACAQR